MANGKHVLAIVLAGGKGSRLSPLTDDRAKPAVPYAGSYRIIDFVLSNMVNGGYRKLVVLTQYKSHSLDLHISRTWRMSTLIGNYVTTVPAQQRVGDRWFSGSADAIYQSLNLVYDERPDYIIVFGADHIYRMDPEQMVDAHIASGKGVTVAGMRVPRSDSRHFGVIDANPDGTIKQFLEKPLDPPGLPDSPDEIFASMGNYVFTADALIEAVRLDAADENSMHDMGGNIIPAMVAADDAMVYDFADNVVPGATDRDCGYWRDVGTIDAYYEANMDLVSPLPVFNLYNDRWPIFTYIDPLPPAKVVSSSSRVSDSLLCNGAIVSDGVVERSVLSPRVYVDHGARVEASVLMHNVQVGAGAVVRNAIIDKNVVIPPGARIGVDLDRDRELYTISDAGVVCIGKNVKVVS
ncbi:MAG: glucose-phosphate adenylyltransferase [Frankiaceae bacterium]|jgi:glucose-1-phosphate adenylyltransferase|nr:glucose-phosphate adenylyltransferase [Frankiaceae bacterium]